MTIEETALSLMALIEERTRVTPFRPGLSEEEINRFEESVGNVLSSDHRKLLATINGQPEESPIKFPPDQLTFLSTEEMLHLREEQLEYSDGEYDEEITYHGKVRATLCHPARIPIAAYEDGSAYLWVDNAPGPAGRVGQIIFNVNEIDFVVIEDGIAQLFARFLSLLETGAADITQIPSEHGEGYWLTRSGQYMDFPLYERLKSELDGIM